MSVPLDDINHPLKRALRVIEGKLTKLEEDAAALRYVKEVLEEELASATARERS